MRLLPQPCVVLVVVSLLCFGCGEDDVDDHQIIPRTEPPTADATELDTQIDAAGTDADADPRCQGRAPGAVCELPNATGVCAEGRCRFLSCEAGFRNCDDDLQTGCETGITDADSCGACGVSCAAAETCQLGRAGWLCSASPVCPDGRYDLDGRLDNGCEWQVELGAEGVFEPATFQPDDGALADAANLSVAGTDGAGRIVTHTDASAAPEALALVADDDTRAVDAVLVDDLLAVAWDDAVTVSSARASSGADSSFVPDCPDASPRCELRGLSAAGSTLFVVDGRSVFAVDFGPGCADEPSSDSAARQLCAAPRASFVGADYLDAFDTEASADFTPIGATHLAASELLAVFTTRGVVLLRASDDAFEPVARLERPADTSGRRFVAAAAVEDAAGARAHLLSDDGTLRSLRVDPTGQGATIGPAAADIGLDMRAASPSHLRLVAGDDGVVLASDGRSAWLMRPSGRSGRVAALAPPADLLTDSRVVYATTKPASGEAGFAVLYFSFGRYFLQRAVRAQ